MKTRVYLLTASLLTLLVVLAAPVESQSQRRVLTAADFEYVGAMRVPTAVTGYGRGGRLTHRYVDGELRFLLTGHVMQNGPIFEITAPGFAPDWRQAPSGVVVRVWGDVYGGRKIASDSGSSQVWTEDLEWFEDRLYWSYGHSYPVAQADDPSIGLTAGGSPAGPWRTSLGSKLTRGYITVIPKWFADRYTDGRRLAVGSGLRSGNIVSSWGPNLAAIPAPTPGTSTSTVLPAMPLVQYSYDHRLSRENDYTPHSMPPDLPGGIWTQQDFIESAVWIDLPEVHGVVFFGGLAGGDVWYGPNPSPEGWRDPCGSWQGPHAEEYGKRWWIYDPMSFVPVAGGNTWDVKPASVIEPNAAIGAKIDGACLGAATGATFDPATRMLYVSYPETDPSEAGNLPVIHAFRIRGGSGGSIPGPGTGAPGPGPVPGPGTDAEIPTVPTNVRVTTDAPVAENVMVRWDPSTDNVAVVNYELFVNGSQVGNSVETFNEEGPVLAGRTYSIQVRAMDGEGNRSALSTPLLYRRQADSGSGSESPSAPTNLRVTSEPAGKDNVITRWDAPTGGAAVANYELFRDGRHVGNGSETFNEEGPIEPGRTYRFEVRAVDSAGNASPFSAPLLYSGGPQSSGPQEPSLPAPTNVRITTERVGNGNVMTRWDAPAGAAGIVNYELFRDGQHVGNGTDTFNEDGPIVSGRTYRFEVRAVDAAGRRSAFSQPLMYQAP